MPPLDAVQIFTFLVFITFYLPCLSTFAVMAKVLGRREALFTLAVSLASALLLAALVRAGLRLVLALA